MVSVAAVAARPTVPAGATLPIAVVLRHAPGFHTWPVDPRIPRELAGLVPIPTSLSVVRLPAGGVIERVEWPTARPVTVRYTGKRLTLPAYADTAVIYVVTTMPTIAVGPTEVVLAVRYQACDDRVCLPPSTDTIRVPIAVQAGVSPDEDAPPDAALFAGLGRGRVVRGSSDLPLRVFGLELRVHATGLAGLAIVLAAAFLGGLILNFTPCVLPLIPIKIMTLQAVADRPSRQLLLGAMQGAGVLTFWLGLGATAAVITGLTSINVLFQTPWFSAGVGVVIAVMGAAMLGNASVPVPRILHGLNPPAHRPRGAFGLGILTGALSTPCTAPLMGASLAWALAQEPMTGIVVFAAVGGGMAAPYVVLAANPRLLARLPHAGPMSVMIKRALGLLLLSVAVFFLGTGIAGLLHHPPDPAPRGYWWGVAALIAGTGAYTVWAALHVARSWTGRLAGTFAGLAMIVAAGWTAMVVTRDGPIRWLPYTPDRFAAAVARQEVILLDFTAEWCLNCKVLETTVLDRRPVTDAVGQSGVVPMRVDLTGDNPAGRTKLRNLGAAGIPLLAIYGPGLQAPLTYDSYTPPMVVQGIARARRRTLSQ